MKRLHSFAVLALVTPVLSLGAASVLAQSSTAQNSGDSKDVTSCDQDARGVSMPEDDKKGGQSGAATDCDAKPSEAQGSTTSKYGTNQNDQGTQRNATSNYGTKQSDQDAQRSTTSMPGANQRDQNAQRTGQSDTQTASERIRATDQSNANNAKSRGYIGSAPINGMQASELIGAKVRTTGDEDVGPVNDLIIGEDGRVVAIVIGVGGFLGMGEKDVAVGWDHVTRSGTTDDRELRIDVTRDDLRSAPKFAQRD